MSAENFTLERAKKLLRLARAGNGEESTVAKAMLDKLAKKFNTP